MTLSELGITALSQHEWDAFAAGYSVGLDHGRQAAEDAEDARRRASYAEAVAVLDAATSWPIVDPRIVTASDAELREFAAERERAGIAGFRADHERRRAEVGG